MMAMQKSKAIIDRDKAKSYSPKAQSLFNDSSDSKGRFCFINSFASRRRIRIVWLSTSIRSVADKR
jgi:hypothetical protein